MNYISHLLYSCNFFPSLQLGHTLLCMSINSSPGHWIPCSLICLHTLSPPSCIISELFLQFLSFCTYHSTYLSLLGALSKTFSTLSRLISLSHFPIARKQYPIPHWKDRFILAKFQKFESTIAQLHERNDMTEEHNEEGSCCVGQKEGSERSWGGTCVLPDHSPSDRLLLNKQSTNSTFSYGFIIGLT